MAKKRRARKSRRKTYRTKRAALKAAHGREVYGVKGPPRGWRISNGAKVRGKRGRQLKRNKAKRAKKKRHKRKRIKKITIAMGNPNPYVCGYE